MTVAANETIANWAEAAVAIAGIALVGCVTVVVVWQLLATWRARMLGAREAEYRRLAEQSVAAQQRLAEDLEDMRTELRSLRDREKLT